jgi:carbon storage regulator
MLILTRFAGESIILSIGGQKATVKVLDISGRKARIGIDAPPDVVIYRDELAEAFEGNGNAN